VTNPVTGNPGALQFAGNDSTPTYCNCSTPINSWYKAFSPRIGVAYAVTPNTVIRAGYSLDYNHGTGQKNATYRGTGTVGFTASPNFTSLTSGDQAFNLNNGFPSYPQPPTINPGYGAAFSTAVTTPSATLSYADPYLGGRQPYADMFNVGIEQQFTKDLALKIAYVGTQGHFLPAASSGARGLWSNQIDPKYLALGGLLNSTVTPSILTQAAALGFNLTLPYPTFSGTLTQMLKPFPQYNTITDTYDNMDNSNYNALQVILKQRVSNGLQFMVNYTWGAEIDDNGTFRSGDLPPASNVAAVSQILPKSSTQQPCGICLSATARCSILPTALSVSWSAVINSPASTLTTPVFPWLLHRPVASIRDRASACLITIRPMSEAPESTASMVPARPHLVHPPTSISMRS
jgi:hypothetical protein